ncbi:MAG: hypothetical protein HUK22_07020 [Thermoguttaceae bacterium]|nr:hypothetical protein [Thermoguttaceae bacterium]
MLKILTEASDREIITLETKGSTLVVDGEIDNFHYTLTTCPPDDFPVVGSFDEAAYQKVETKYLAALIRRTVYSIDSENSHYALGGVLFNFEGDKITAVSTDGRRLSYIQCPAEAVGELPKDDKTIFPPKTLNLIERASGDVAEVLIAAKEGQAVVKVGNLTISSVLIDGHFPNWRAILPEKSSRRSCRFIAGTLAAAVRKAEIVATEKKPGVWLKFEEGRCVVAAAGEEVGDSSVTLPVEYAQETTDLRFDSRFLNEYLRCIAPDETISFYFLPDKPALFETEDNYQYVVMPLA